MSLSGVFRIEVDLLCEDVPAKFGLYYKRISGGPAADQCPDLVDLWWATFAATLKPILSSFTIIQRIIGRALTPSDGNPYEANFVTTTVGTGAAEPMPPSIAALFRIRCTSTNSRNNGHFYVPGIPESVWVNGAYTGGFITSAGNFSAALLADIGPSAGGVSYGPCVVHRFEDNIELVNPTTFDYLSVELQPKISQQRRRQSGQQGIKA